MNSNSMTSTPWAWPSATRKIRTLIVEDEPVQREVLRLMLSHEPDVDIVGLPPNGPAALADICQLSPDLVFLDVEMPVWDGLEPILGAANSKLRPYFVFITSGLSNAPKVSPAPTLDVMVKPYTRDLFADVLLRARRQLQRLAR